MVDPYDVESTADTSDPATIVRPAPLGRLRIRTKLYLAFSVIAGLFIASAVVATIWTGRSNAEILRNLSLLEHAKQQSAVIELTMITASDAIRGYLLDPTNEAEARRKRAADDEFRGVVEELTIALADMPSVVQAVTELATYDAENLDPAENRLIEIAHADIGTAKRFYKYDYLPLRERETAIILGLRQEVARTEAVVKANAAQTYVAQLVLRLGGVAVISVVAGLLAWLCARAIGDQIQAMTTAMGKLADGDTTIAIPAQLNKDEIGDMARAVGVFRDNAIARREGELALRRTNLQLDAALNSMLQGMVVWSPDLRVQLVNERFFAICGIPARSIVPDMTVSEYVANCICHGMYPGEDPAEVEMKATWILTQRRSVHIEKTLRPGLLVRITSEPMANGGAVVTLEDVTEKRRNEERIAFMAGHDTLTGLPNRTMLQEHTDAAVARLGDGQHFAMLCLDLDHFKEVNDTFGHAAGDELLRQAAGRLRHCVRGVDVVARLGSDEFAILQSGTVAGPAPATALAARLTEALGAPYEIQGNHLVVTATIGIALVEPGVPSADLLKQADVALQRAKEMRGSLVLFEPGMDAHLRARRALETDLRLALQHGEFELNYQPQYNLEQNRVTAFEALLRWNSPTRGRVSPADFIPLAEQTRLIIPIGAWVLHTACVEAATWPEHVRVAVNLSPVQFEDQRLVSLVRETLEATGLSPRRLELEITETVLLQDSEAVMATLYSLHDLGLRVSMDDFGTGYSSLSYLHRFPFDKIKIDRSFISDLRIAPLDANDATAPDRPLSSVANSAAIIVRAISGLGANLGILTTAEGVETAEQLAQVRREGCIEVQGYFISPPRPAAEVAALLLRLDTTLPAIAGSRRASPQRVA
jgi:diguanylate cyclase (GGDEF)-like protein